MHLHLRTAAVSQTTGKLILFISVLLESAYMLHEHHVPHLSALQDKLMIWMSFNDQCHHGSTSQVDLNHPGLTC